MVMPCCERCYSKYIEKDKRTIKQSFLDNAFGTDTTYHYRPSKVDPFILPMIKKQNLPMPEECVVVSSKGEEVLCTCECHVEGLAVFH